MSVLKCAWMVLVTSVLCITVLYLYIGKSLNISIKFTVKPKESVMQSFLKPSNWKDPKPPKPIMNITKYQRKRHKKTPKTTPSTTTKVMTSTLKSLTSTSKSLTSTSKLMTTTPKSMTSTPNHSSTKSSVQKLAYKRLSSEAKRVVAKTISPKDKAILMDLLGEFLKIADRLNLTYMMAGGTLLGSWRHHGMIPWDDDIDFLVKESQQPKLLAAIKKLEPQYMGPDTKPVIKFYSNKSRLIPGQKWRYPFIDICFFKDNGKVMWDTIKYFSRIKYNLKRIFPLHKRPFETFEVYAPRDSLYFIETGYKSSKSYCTTWHYSHAKETGGHKVHSIACDRLKNVVPFVHRQFLNGTMEEVLKLGSKVIHTKYVVEERRNLCRPYDLKRI